MNDEILTDLDPVLDHMYFCTEHLIWFAAEDCPLCERDEFIKNIGDLAAAAIGNTSRCIEAVLMITSMCGELLGENPDLPETLKNTPR